MCRLVCIINVQLICIINVLTPSPEPNPCYWGSAEKGSNPCYWGGLLLGGSAGIDLMPACGEAKEESIKKKTSPFFLRYFRALFS